MRARYGLVLGFGKNDYQGETKVNKVTKPFYQVWTSMIRRCYGANVYKTYENCVVCEEWRSVTKFKEWYDKHYVEGWQLDKDLLSKEKKIYSPDTCCFLPKEINMFLTRNVGYYRNNKINHPTCIRYDEYRKKYLSLSRRNHRTVRVAYCDNLEEAEAKLKAFKEAVAKEYAEKYKDSLDPRAYKALMEYEYKC